MSMQEVREQNIALVTQSALACFVENGIEKTTIRDIAQHAGLTERSVYRYFAGKDELVIAAAYLYWDRAKELAAQSLAKQRRRGMTGIEEIRVLLRSTRSSTARRSALRSPPARSRRPSAAASPTGRSTPTPMSRCSTIMPTMRFSASSSVCPSVCRVCTSSTGTCASTRCASSSRAHSRRRPSNKGTGNTF